MKLLLTGAFNYNIEQIEKIKLLGFNVFFVQDEQKQVQDEMLDVDCVICNALFLYNDIKLFKNLKYIQLTSVGTDRIPLEYVCEHNITLKTAGNVYSVPMAEWTVLKILEIFKSSRFFYEMQSQNIWEKKRNLREMLGKTAVIVGFGNVGQEIAKRLRGFDVNIIAVDIRKIGEGLWDKFFLFENLDEALSKGDMVILTLPLTDETHGLFGENRFSVMKSGAILINIARGGLINEQAFIKALHNGILSGAALDVFEVEPLPPASPLWDMENVIITPHNSFVSDKVNERLFNLIISNLAERNIHA